MKILYTVADIYQAIQDLSEQDNIKELSLEIYLRGLLKASEQFSQQDGLSNNEFYHMLENAINIEPYPFVKTWQDHYQDFAVDADGYVGWRNTLIQQIVDLHEMDEAGVFERSDAQLFLDGAYSPRGKHFYNFHPPSYLECAAAGYLGYWPTQTQQTDSSSAPRILVPQTPAQELEELHSQAGQPSSDAPKTTRPHSWSDLLHFLWAGQEYE